MKALSELVIAPANMQSTRMDDVFEIIDGRSRPYTINKDHSLRNATFVDTSNKIPGGGLISTAEDLARFSIALESNTLLNAEITKLMWASQTTTDGKPTGYGYGWDVKQQNGILWVEHTGRQPGSSSILLLLPSRGFAVSIMSNTDNMNITPIAKTTGQCVLEHWGCEAINNELFSKAWSDSFRMMSSVAACPGAVLQAICQPIPNRRAAPKEASP